MPRFYYQTSSLLKDRTGEDSNFQDLITFTIKGEREKPNPALFHWCKSRFTYLIAEFCSTHPTLILRSFGLLEVMPICILKLKKPLNSWLLEAGKIFQGKYYSVLLPYLISKHQPQTSTRCRGPLGLLLSLLWPVLSFMNHLKWLSLLLPKMTKFAF